MSFEYEYYKENTQNNNLFIVHMSICLDIHANTDNMGTIVFSTWTKFLVVYNSTYSTILSALRGRILSVYIDQELCHYSH